MFGKVLIANRGEIAVRIAQTLRAMGVTTVAVYSDPDRAAVHVAAADEAYALPGTTSSETYLRGDAIIEIARAHGVDAIHPGYGFLAENADFAHACDVAGLTFIGPPVEAIRAMGDKVIAKQLMADAGVPVVPGVTGETTVDAMRAQAESIGFPLLIKAAAGGGGKGMRVVRDAGDLQPAFEAARREAGAAFGDTRVFLEKYLDRARHVEFQVFGDSQGSVVHLFDRDCSIQRRHQKIIEEAPAPGISPALRERMGAAAVRAAQAVGYTNAGTVEFMLDEADESFFFLEVNTRLQVEHPVTELTIGHDLVETQVRVAAGEPLPFTQASLEQRGHAIECRVYAEDAARDFLPSTGTIEAYEPPSGPGVRVDSGIAAGSQVSVHYDPLLAKVITRGATRADAIATMIRALDRLVVMGVTTNVDFLRGVLEHHDFRAARLHTRFLEEHSIALAGDPPFEAFAVAALAQAMSAPGARRVTGAASPTADDAGPWRAAGPWRVG